MAAEEKALQDGWKRLFLLAKKFQSDTLPAGELIGQLQAEDTPL